MTDDQKHQRAGRRPASGKSRTAGTRGPRRRDGADSARGGRSAHRAGPVATRVAQVAQLLEQMLRWDHPADRVLSSWLRAHREVGARDREEVAEAVFDTLRHLRRYRQLAQSGQGEAHRRLAILGLAATQADARLAPVLTEAERTWLAHLHTIDEAALPEAVRLSVPDWLYERLAVVPERAALLAAMNQGAPLDLRVNVLKARRDALLAAWQGGAEARWQPQATPYSPLGIRLQGRPPVSRWPAFLNGEIEVQDEGSQMVASLLEARRGEMVIDYCAGAGGKTLLLGAQMRSTGRLYAFDVSAARLARARPRLARSGLSNVVPVVIAAHGDARVRRLRGKAHRVLVDAPCSGLGTLRRNPDLKWRQQPHDIDELVRLQADILRRAATCVRPGGRLVYASCSVLPEENERQVQAFLAENTAFEALDARAVLGDELSRQLGLEDGFLRLRPDRHGTDAFFAAVLTRRATPEAVG